MTPARRRHPALARKIASLSDHSVPCTPCYGRGWNYTHEQSKRTCRYCGGTGRMTADKENS